MIIKIIPEKGETHIKEVEHHNIKEFLIFGNKKDADGELIDFHDWSGQYRYLIGSLFYFQGMLANEQSGKSMPSPRPSMEMPKPSTQGMLKQIPSDYPNLQILKAGKEIEGEIIDGVDGDEMEVEEPIIEDVPVDDNQEPEGRVIELVQPDEF